MKKRLLFSLLMLLLAGVCSGLSARDRNPFVYTNKQTLDDISGYYNPGTQVLLYRNAHFLLSTSSNAQGEYKFSNLMLEEGLNTFELRTQESIINNLKIIRDSQPPVITAQSTLSDTEKNHIRDVVSITVNVNEPLKELYAQMPDNKFIKFVAVDKARGLYQATWIIPPSLRYRSRYPVKISGVDLADNWGRNDQVGFAIEPRFEVITPTDNAFTFDENVEVAGYADPGMQVFLNGAQIQVDKDGVFNLRYHLKDEKNLLSLKALRDDMSPQVRDLKVIQQKTYSDLAQVTDNAARKDIEVLATLKILPPDPEKSFRPQEAITRAELATWLIKALDIKLPQLKQAVAKDVPAEYWRAPYIKLCLDLGFFQLDANGNFWPNDEVSNAEGDDIFKKFDNLTAHPAQKLKSSLGKFFSTFTSLMWGMIAAPANAEEIEESPDHDKLTRLEAARKLSSTRTVKQKVQSLMDWGKGFDKLNAVSVAPEIRTVQLKPSLVPNDGFSIFMLEVKLYDPQGLNNIKGVLADLHEINALPSYTLVDNGKWGDQKANDGIYTLQTVVKPTVSTGEKNIDINASNRMGWVAVSSVRLQVKAVN